MSKEYIELKLHNGKVPYFVERTFSNCNISGKYYGISRDTEQCYLPATVVIKTEDEFKAVLLANAKLYNYVDEERIEMTEEEKVTYIEDFISDWIEG